MPSHLDALQTTTSWQVPERRETGFVPHRFSEGFGGIWSDFGTLWEAKMDAKIDFLGIFFDVFFECIFTLILG